VVTVQLKDEDGHNIFGGAYEVRLETDFDFGQITEPELQDDGTYQAVFSATRPGRAIIRGTVEGAEIGNTAVVEVAVGAADVDRSTITASPTAITTDDSAVVTVQLKDRHGNARATGDDTVEVFVDGEEQLAVEFADGVYTATFIPEKTGTVTFSGTVNGQPLGSTSTVNVTPGAASPDTSTITAEPEILTTDETAVITVQLKDAKGNELTEPGGIVTLSTQDGEELAVTYAGNGAYSSTFYPETLGSVTITGTVNGEIIASQVTLIVLPGAADPGTSTITAAPAAITTDGTAIITVQLRDAKGNELVDGGDTVTLTAGDEGQLEVEYAGGGAYIATFDPKTPGLVTITGTVNGHAIDSTATIKVSVGAASPDTSTITADPEAITTDGAATITVQL